jgi:hypothetical protein
LGVGCWMFGVGCFPAVRFRLGWTRGPPRPTHGSTMASRPTSEAVIRTSFRRHATDGRETNVTRLNKPGAAPVVEVYRTPVAEGGALSGRTAFPLTAGSVALARAAERPVVQICDGIPIAYSGHVAIEKRRWIGGQPRSATVGTPGRPVKLKTVATSENHSPFRA